MSEAEIEELREVCEHEGDPEVLREALRKMINYFDILKSIFKRVE